MNFESYMYMHLLQQPRLSREPCDLGLPQIPVTRRRENRVFDDVSKGFRPSVLVKWDIPPVAQELDLLLALPLDPPVSLPGPPFGVLPLQQHILQCAPACQKQNHIRHHDAMADAVFGLVRGPVNVAADDAIEIAKADDEAKRYTAFVDAFGVVGGPVGSSINQSIFEGTGRCRCRVLPHDSIGDARIDTQSTKERPCVLYTRGFGTEKHRETNDTKKRGEDVTKTTLAGSISNVSDGDGQYGGGGVWRHGE